ncbi:hypothetical protein HPB52_010332 [Rhipicephalus sanguineus]|uniref:Uncharacterized protein n=1 Tax=Rhipicephalus sanguineus TaxID=34632 RepID=A0A9D4SYL2_RHISA|nr:hypothetical protein HPB52_010332 [Rhipicephalus sanguineus]
MLRRCSTRLCVSTAAVVEISGNQAHGFRGGEEEIVERRTAERDVAEVGVATDAVCEDAARRDGVADPERAADGAEVENENKKMKKKREHYGRRSNVEAAEQVGDEQYAEVDELSVDYADVDCHDGKEREEFGDVEAAAIDEERAENAGGDDDTDAWEGAADGADSEAEEGADEVAYYGERKGLARDGEWDEMECVDADDAKVVDDVDGAASAEDEGAVAEASDNKAEKSEKAEKSKGEKPEKPDEQSGKPVLGPGKGPSLTETTQDTAAFPGELLEFETLPLRHSSIFELGDCVDHSDNNARYSNGSPYSFV